MTNRSVLLKADGLLLNHYINRLPPRIDGCELNAEITRLKRRTEEQDRINNA